MSELGIPKQEGGEGWQPTERSIDVLFERIDAENIGLINYLALAETGYLDHGQIPSDADSDMPLWPFLRDESWAQEDDTIEYILPDVGGRRSAGTVTMKFENKLILEVPDSGTLVSFNYYSPVILKNEEYDALMKCSVKAAEDYSLACVVQAAANKSLQEAKAIERRIHKRRDFRAQTLYFYNQLLQD